ncbi:heterokaryon incompatibility protein-domain-containing protein [Paraphoma chrysanthemicola]|uniref:Heterokaryon incompatibility protein-domain-containing protein n=1 Tax=Paraphoma chrysanthemicola TaxID=798071 RepID=A0A8K0RID2_9PLEO|nr:heterokaryon incompatibility protein-domain-containing protein [Paraphoma chrysanthemicola]
MRLINCSTRKLEEYFGDDIPSYAILSHTWGSDEVTFADMTCDQAAAERKKGYQKIDYTCIQALDDALNYAWVDTCCIDKSSSAELSEAINSMFDWYKKASICYAYLSDVVEERAASELSKSRWFTRGWTLQELLAPTHVTFYDVRWQPLGSKSDSAHLISKITAIDERALGVGVKGPYSLYRFSVATRMSWASRRQTTRVEDVAYSLLGIFDIDMPLLYGEGRRAFVRLQEEIIRRTPDDSILAWGLNASIQDDRGQFPGQVVTAMQDNWGFLPILASSPADFEDCRNLTRPSAPPKQFATTNFGLHCGLPLVPVMLLRVNNFAQSPGSVLGWIGLLSCSPHSASESFVGILLRSASSYRDSNETLRRVALDPTSHNGTHKAHSAIAIGPRAAVRADMNTVTILQTARMQLLRRNVSQCRQFILNVSNSLAEAKYKLVSGESQLYNRAGPDSHRHEILWNPSSNIITTEAYPAGPELLTYRFEYVKSDHDYGRYARAHHIKYEKIDGQYMVAADSKTREPVELLTLPDSVFTVSFRTDRSSYLVRQEKPFVDDGKATDFVISDGAPGEKSMADVVDMHGTQYTLILTQTRKVVHHWQVVRAQSQCDPYEINQETIRIATIAR